MGGGLSERNTLLAQCMTALFEALAFLITGIHGITVPTAGPKWTEVLTMRLGDVDEALRLFGEEYEKTKELIHNGESQLDSLAEGFTEAHHIIKYVLPTVDAVPVVRCKDCKHLCVWNRKDIYAFCPKTNIVFLPFDKDTRAFFCSLGERKEGGDG